MTDNFNVYADDLLELYTDLQNTIINPIMSPAVLLVDLRNTYDKIESTLHKIDDEFASPTTDVTGEEIVSSKMRICGYLNGIRTGILRYVICTQSYDGDDKDIRQAKSTLYDIITKYEDLMCTKMREYTLSIHLPKTH